MKVDESWVSATDFVPAPPAKARKEAQGSPADIAPPPDLAITKRPRRQPGKPLLTIEGLTVSFPKSGTIFKELDLTIREGEKVCIVGSNGAGKSTLIKACLGIVPAQAGTITMLGERYSAINGPSPELLAKVGMIHQRHNLIARSTALANAIHGALGRSSIKPLLWYQNFAPTELREQALGYLHRLGIAEKAGNLAKELSGGQSQRVAIARALMQDPKCIIADEPVASLDPVSGLQVMDVFAKMVDEEDRTLIFISHHLSHAIQFADRIVGIKDNKIGFDVDSDATTYEELESIYGD